MSQPHIADILHCQTVSGPLHWCTIHSPPGRPCSGHWRHWGCVVASSRCGWCWWLCGFCLYFTRMSEIAPGAISLKVLSITSIEWNPQSFFSRNMSVQAVTYEDRVGMEWASLLLSIHPSPQYSKQKGKKRQYTFLQQLLCTQWLHLAYTVNLNAENLG